MRPLEDIIKDLVEHKEISHFKYIFADDGFAANFLYKTVCYNLIASNGLDWDHVSLSSPNHTPGWDTMCFAKDICFKPDELAFQLHPKREDNINIHNHCLHLWRPQLVDIPLPPRLMV